MPPSAFRAVSAPGSAARICAVRALPGRVVEGHGRDGAGRLDEQSVRARLMVRDGHAAAFPWTRQITMPARSFSISTVE